MRTKELEFLLMYAEVYGLQKLPVTEVVEQAANYLNSEEVMDSFIECYHSMKHYHLEDEIEASMARGDTFLEACKEWDILEYPYKEVAESTANEEYDLKSLADDVLDDFYDLWNEPEDWE